MNKPVTNGGENARIKLLDEQQKKCLKAGESTRRRGRGGGDVKAACQLNVKYNISLSKHLLHFKTWKTR